MVLHPAEKAAILKCRRGTLLPLDAIIGCLKDTITNLSRSALHRCLLHHRISRLPANKSAEKRKRCKTEDSA